MISLTCSIDEIWEFIGHCQRPTVNPRALIFDMDGVIVDSEALHESAKPSVPQASKWMNWSLPNIPVVLTAR
jgi:hypothetical protein